MKVRFAQVVLSAMMCSAAAVQAFGADFGSGSQSYGAAIPVPAPIPIPEYDAEYYIRMDVGGTIDTSAHLENYGSHFELKDDSDLQTSIFGSVGIGRYLTPSIRAELSISIQDDVGLSPPNESYYTDTRSARGPDFSDATGTYPTFDTHHYDVVRTDIVKFSQGTGLLSLYYDIKTGSSFTPYVGAGIGATWRQLKRNATEIAECDYTTNTLFIYPTDNCVSNTELPTTYESSTAVTTSRWNVAAAAMAGFAYEFADGMYWDNAYRLLWQNGALQATVPTVSGESTVVIEDVIQHQFMTGLRFDIN